MAKTKPEPKKTTAARPAVPIPRKDKWKKVECGKVETLLTTTIPP